MLTWLTAGPHTKTRAICGQLCATLPMPSVVAAPTLAAPPGFTWVATDDPAAQAGWELRPLDGPLALFDASSSTRLLDAYDAEHSAALARREAVERAARAPVILEHTVQPSDTLAGVCLRYEPNEKQIRIIVVETCSRFCGVPLRVYAGTAVSQRRCGEPMVATMTCARSRCCASP